MEDKIYTNPVFTYAQDLKPGDDILVTVNYNAETESGRSFEVTSVDQPDKDLNCFKANVLVKRTYEDLTASPPGLWTDLVLKTADNGLDHKNLPEQFVLTTRNTPTCKSSGWRNKEAVSRISGSPSL